jgi:hypothetical protein
MNTSRLLDTIEGALKAEEAVPVQEALVALTNIAQQLSQNPSGVQLQSDFSSTLSRFSDAARRMRSQFSPTQIEALGEISAAPYFTDDLTSIVGAWISANAMTPAVVHQKLSQLSDARTAFLSDLRSLVENLKKIGVHTSSLTPGEAEIGFLLPRMSISAEI